MHDVVGTKLWMPLLATFAAVGCISLKEGTDRGDASDVHVDGATDSRGDQAPPDGADVPSEERADALTPDDAPPQDVGLDLTNDVDPDTSPPDATVDATADDGLDAPPDAPLDAPPDVTLDTPEDLTPDGGDVDACPAGQMRCDGACVDTATNPAHCGACGTRCDRAFPNAAGACAAGTCRLGACAEGFGDCDSTPTNGCEARLDTNSHCGRCGNACVGGTPLCRATGGAATCVSDCAAGQTRCGSSCVDTTSDAAHCGACDRRCPAPTGGSATCASSACGTSCPSGQVLCGGACVTVGQACSSRGSGGCQQAGTTMCSGGAVVCSAAPRTSGSCSSPSGGVCNGSGDCVCTGGNCGGACVDLTSNPSHCAACGRACGAGQYCSGGNCITSCASPNVICGGSCVSVGASCMSAGSGGCQQSGTTACIGGSVACNVGPRTSGSCSGIGNGVCNTSGNCVCPAGTSPCNGSCQPVGGGCTSGGSGGCQQTGTFVCGAGGVSCNAAPRTSGSCSGPTNGVCNASGACVCPAGRAECALGACTDLSSNTTHCGACGRNCSGMNVMSVVCSGGRCASPCSSGWANCDGDVLGSCETLLLGDARNCGACGRVCTYLNGQPRCVSGACTWGPCNAPYDSCDGNLENGCETNESTDVNHCGYCGNRCSFANAGATCSGGVCALGRCNTNFGNCDGNAANGCETTLSSASNCGGCGVRCTSPYPNCRNLGGVGYMCASF